MSYIDLYFDRPNYIIDTNTSSPILFGVPFDSTHSFRPGTRFGPNAIRELFYNIEMFIPEFSMDIESITLNDLGNIKHTVVAKEMIRMVKKITTELINKNKQILILGGEHLITLGSYESFPHNVGYLVFDAHYDLRNEYADTKLNHATYLRRIIENNGNADNIIHVGARAYSKEELIFKTENNIKTITNKDICNGIAPKLLKDLLSTFDNIYLSIDMDVLDPAYAPGVGNPEALGITTRELYDMLYSLHEKNIVATDIVELCPMFDNGSTSAIAARLLSYMIAMNKSRSL